MKAKSTKKKIKKEISGEVTAAISFALYLNQNDSLDMEKAILTINKTTNLYSPWSSKIYGLRRNPRYNNF